MDSKAMHEYDDQRPRAVSEFLVRVSSKHLPESPYASPSDETHHESSIGWKRELSFRNIRRWSLPRLLVCAAVGAVSLLALLQVGSSVGQIIAGLWPEQVDWLLSHVIQFDPSDEMALQWSEKKMSGIKPVACLSHNDEWQRRPLYAAIKAGCTSFEADVWFFNGEIFVGHSPSELSPERTMRSLYLDHLQDIVQKSNGHTADEHIMPREGNALRGAFPADPAQSLVFLVDVKTARGELLPLLYEQLEPLRAANYLTYYDGTDIVQRPVTIVVSGRASFETVTANETYRDIFYDAPLDKLGNKGLAWSKHESAVREEQLIPLDRPALLPGSTDDSRGQSKKVNNQHSETLEDYSVSNSFFASTSFRRSIGSVWGSRLTQGQLQRIRSHVREAHDRGLKARYWETPMWPTGLRNYIWQVLVREGVDIVGVDDLYDSTRVEWMQRHVDLEK